MGRVEPEVELVGEPGGHLVEQASREIVNPRAVTALGMQVRRGLVIGEVIGRCAVPEVDVLDHPESGKCLKGAIDARPGDGFVGSGDGLEDFVRGVDSLPAPKKNRSTSSWPNSRSQPPERGCTHISSELGNHRSS